MATKTKTKSKVSGQAVMEEIKSLALLTGGVVIGSISGKMLDKMLKVDPNLTGINVKAFVRPLALIGAGAAGNIFFKDRNMKLIATGIGASGVLSGVKVVLKKDLLAGLDNFTFNGIQGFLGEPSVYREPTNLSVDRYNPDLPVLSAASGFPTRDDSSEYALEGSPVFFEII
jgi:hypothetical protein